MNTLLDNNSVEKAKNVYNELDRNKKFDLHLNKIAYYNELVRTQDLISEFRNRLIEQMIVLEFGGNRIILDTIDNEELTEYLFDKLVDNESQDDLIRDLSNIYYSVVNTHCGFCSIIEENKVFKEKEIDLIIEELICKK